MARDNEHVEVEGEVRGNGTDAAILFYVEDLDEEMWFPRSQVELSSDGGSLLVPRWLAEKKGIE